MHGQTEYPESIIVATEEALWVIHHWWIHKLGRRTHPRIMGFTFQPGEIVLPDEYDSDTRQYRSVSFTALVVEYNSGKNEVVAQFSFSAQMYQDKKLNTPWFPMGIKGTVTLVPSGETQELDWMPSSCMDDRTQRGNCKLNRLQIAIDYFA